MSADLSGLYCMVIDFAREYNIQSIKFKSPLVVTVIIRSIASRARISIIASILMSYETD